MTNSIRYVHTNLIAKDWKRLSEFYINTLHCTMTYPERNLFGKWIDTLTEIDNVKIRGAHIKLPGYENGPTLEIFEYDPECRPTDQPKINAPGFGHIAFQADNIEVVLASILMNGGSKFGEIVQKDYPELGLLTVIYARDPEGNFIELQNWKKQ